MIVTRSSKMKYIIQKKIYLGFAVLELSKLLMYEKYYDKLQLYFDEKIIGLHCMDTDSFVLSLNTKDIIKDSKNLEDIFDFSNLSENHELLSIKKRLLENLKNKTPKKIGLMIFLSEK